VRAAVLHELGKPVTIEEVEIDAPGPGEAKLRIVASGVCRSDYSVASGVLRSPLPVVLGHEAAGVVLEVGEGVGDVQPEDRVIVSLSPECGDCLFCREGRPNLCVQMVPGMVGSTMLDGTTRLRLRGEGVYQVCGVASFAEEAIVCARSCIPVPDDVPLERACLIGCGILTGAGAALNTPEVSDGAGVAVVGCGGVGLSAVQGARIAGAGPIIAVDPDPDKRALALELGATHAVNPREDPAREIRKITGLGVHVAIEAAGRTETIELAWDLLRPAGLVLVIGMPAARERVPIRVGGFFLTKRIAGCVYGNSHPHRDIPLVLEHVRTGTLLLDPLVSHELPLDRVQEALDDIRDGYGVRHVILPDLDEPRERRLV
jgi:S-(hydroxymethyl)glutathione dehydrogenase/alcohol dehydrogenase